MPTLLRKGNAFREIELGTRETETEESKKKSFQTHLDIIYVVVKQLTLDVISQK